MKALSIKQPWAWLICAGYKDIENRNWHIHNKLASTTSLRIYVHAGKTFDYAGWNRLCTQPAFLKDIDIDEWARQGIYPVLGAIIGEVDIVDCKYRFGEENANLYSIWHEVGMYGLLLANPVLYEKPIPCKGKLGFFDPDILEGIDKLEVR